MIEKKDKCGLLMKKREKKDKRGLFFPMRARYAKPKINLPRPKIDFLYRLVYKFILAFALSTLKVLFNTTMFDDTYALFIFPPLVFCLSLSMFLSCFLIFKESEPHVSYKRVSSKKKRVLNEVVLTIDNYSKISN